MNPKLKPKSVEKSVTLSVTRPSGVSVDRHISELQDVLQHGTPAFFQAVDRLCNAGDIDTSKAKSVKAAADYANDLWQSYEKGKTNG